MEACLPGVINLNPKPYVGRTAGGVPARERPLALEACPAYAVPPAVPMEPPLQMKRVPSGSRTVSGMTLGAVMFSNCQAGSGCKQQ